MTLIPASSPVRTIVTVSEILNPTDCETSLICYDWNVKQNMNENASGIETAISIWNKSQRTVKILNWSQRKNVCSVTDCGTSIVHVSPL